MAEKEKENGQEIEEVKSLPLFDKRMKDLLQELDEHMFRTCMFYIFLGMSRSPLKRFFQKILLHQKILYGP